VGAIVPLAHSITDGNQRSRDGAATVTAGGRLLLAAWGRAVLWPAGGDAAGIAPVGAGAVTGAAGVPVLLCDHHLEAIPTGIGRRGCRYSACRSRISGLYDPFV
jgi:hypothetical protein